MAEGKRKFDEDFKQGAVRIVRETGKPIAQVARELGINEGTLGNWCAKDRRQRDGSDAALSEDERAELVRLRAGECGVGDAARRAQALGGPLGERGDGPVSVAGFIAAQRAQYRIPHASACRALGLSQAWFYKWRHGDASPRRVRRDQLRIAIRRLFAAHKSCYGSPRITADLREEGWRVSVNTVAQIMAEQGLRARPKRRRHQTTRPGRARWRAPDLVGRDFAAATINHKWYGDGTEINTEEGKLFLDSVLDVASRRIVGFAMSERHDTDCAYGALAMAVAVRGGSEAVAGVILHTDQGSEYTAHRFRTACQRIGIQQSMGRAGSALDNAVIESWHSTLEFELRSLHHFATRAEARTAVATWIDDYNRHRRHSALQMKCPVDFELGPQAA